MKTLREQVEEIKSATISKAAKKRALISLGITAYEVDLMLEADDSAFTFGVEIECGVNRYSIRDTAIETGMSYNYEGYNHNDGHSHFKFVTDGSLQINDAIECVSPVLKGNKGKKMLKLACETLDRAGASVNRSCGLHVHIGAPKSEKQYANVFNNYFYLEGVIDSFMAPSRRGNNNTYCRSILDHLHLIVAENVDQVRYALNNDRYHKINAESYRRHKTIEFRQHQGTINYKKIIMWVTFCGKLVNWSKKNRLGYHIASIDDIPFLTSEEKEYFKGRAASLGA